MSDKKSMSVTPLRIANSGSGDGASGRKANNVMVRLEERDLQRIDNYVESKRQSHPEGSWSRSSVTRHAILRWLASLESEGT